jgi:Zn-dependent M28 family amino/carboxypeptidase
MKLQPVTQSLECKVDDTGKLLTGSNIYCYLDNGADSTILISAHYDHLGMGGGEHSRSYGKTGIHPGADDNASGVALMMGLTRSYKRWRQKRYNYLFVGYAAHEVGLYGSAAFSNYCNSHFKPVCLAVNFDMVGRLDVHERTIAIYGFPSLYKDGKMMQSGESDVRIYTDEPEKIFITDCKSFAEQGIHCLSFTTGLHADYHKVSDIATKINYDGMYTMQLLAEHVLKSYPLTTFTYEQ